MKPNSVQNKNFPAENGHPSHRRFYGPRPIHCLEVQSGARVVPLWTDQINEELKMCEPWPPAAAKRPPKFTRLVDLVNTADSI